MPQVVNRIFASYLYPTTPEPSPVRSIAHGLKHGDAEAINSAARCMATRVHQDAVLVPIPGSEGHADNMLLLAKAIQRHSHYRVVIADILHSAQRLSHYESKKRGKALTVSDLAMATKAHSYSLSRLILIDNVADTGKTIRSARNALGVEAPAIVYAMSADLLVTTI